MVEDVNKRFQYGLNDLPLAPADDFDLHAAVGLQLADDGVFGPGAGLTSASHGNQLALLRGGGGGGSSRKDWCKLMPGIDRFGFCLYLCPNGDVRRLGKDSRNFGCSRELPPWGGIGL